MNHFRLIPAVYVILRDNNKILLLQRKNTGYHDGDFSLPAGHVDGGETLSEAVIREAKEELGITIEDTALKLVHVLHRKSDVAGNANERVDFYFEAKGWSGNITNMEPEKCNLLEWYAADELPENMIPAVKSVLSAVTSGDIYTNFGWNI
ncbi:MAG: putative hydrolase [Candidatus Saccharibacteria bacterium]|nr:putative hydrolase [Candidatus Saccharibacteria bacterium]